MWKLTPLNFEKHWEGANVILRTQNSNGKELHANKKTLGDNSSYFHAMFFGGFKEMYQDVVEVPCDYIYMLNILRTIHQASPRGRLIGASRVEDLVEMYRVVDMFDIPKIRSMYIEKLDADIVTIALAAMELGNHDMLVNCLEKMTVTKLQKFMEIKNDMMMFCKKDVVFVYEKIVNGKLAKDPYVPLKAMAFPELDESNRRIDLTKKWYASDLVISTRNSDGKLLYANKGVLGTFSKKFHKMFITSNVSLIPSYDFSSIHLDVDYTTMKTILCIIHKCDLNFCSFTTFHPVLLYDMYRFANEFDLPMIMNFVSDRLVKQATAGCLEVGLKLDLQNLVSQLFATMLPSDLRDWVLSGDKDLICNGENGEEVAISSKATDLNLSLNDLRLIFWKLHSKYAK